MKLQKIKSKKLNGESKINKSWKKVKIKGNVFSEEGCGLEGLIGLEVMEDYDTGLIAKAKKKSSPWKEQSKQKKGKRKSISDNSNEQKELIPKKKRKIANRAGSKTIPGQFVLLNKVENENDKTDYPTSMSIDDLQHWNGFGIPETILKALAEKGFKSPTEIQSLTLPAAIMGKKDILGAAETGSGKTLAFGIPILVGILELKSRNSAFGIRKQQKISNTNIKEEELDNQTPPPEETNSVEFADFSEESEVEENENDKEDNKNKPLYAVILTPTRELAVQVKDHITAVAKYTGIKVAAIFGGLAQVKQERILKSCPEIIVGTPGRMWELLSLGNPHLNKIDNISFLVIDETDRMIEKGHFEELRMLLKRLNSDENKKNIRQNFVFSATLTLVHDIPDHLRKKNQNRKLKLVKDTPGLKIQKLVEELGISQPKIVDITRSEQTAQNLTESRILCPIDEKDYYLYYFLQRHPGRTIVFCNSIDCVKRLAKLFTILNCCALPLHANMIQKQRLKNLEKFQINANGLLIATDVAARGLDIPDIQHVIHYQVPRTSENYVHRSGRTARANKLGITIIIMEPSEVKNYLKLCKTLDRNEDLPLFPVSESHMKGVRERVNLAREVDKLELKNKIISSEEGWLKKTAEEMDIIIDSDVEESDSDNEIAMQKSKEKQLLANKRRALISLLSKPLFPKGFSFKYPNLSNFSNLNILNETSFNSDKNSAIKAVQDSIKDLKESKRKKKKKVCENF
ncbi:ATP-dependent RNA helicase DDX24 [Condylostylus longicornis]|uniref:ATP-dependent RNA helicase DDX24 n=1 Tax=Condylostylus longicornis TaxID=2530218 RepID=UPI00244E295B|nr:ATP-dependent RNA helicase DDX24 [Condylostylus longicornis]